MGFDILPYNGTFRAYHLAAIVFISSFMAGYDSGVAGGILTFKPFESDFHYTTKQKTKVNSLTVGLEQLGSFLACFIIYPATNKFGRKYCIMGSAAVFVLGALIQTINTGNLAGWYVARVIAGLGMGGLSVVVPMYSAEMTPKEIRGRCGSFYQWFYTFGVLISYWIDYGANLHTGNISRKWQIPVGMQLLSSGLLVIGAFTLPESCRWLLTQNRNDEAWKSLSWVRADTGEKALTEFREIQQGLQAEHAAKANFSIRELWQPSNRLRFFIGPMLFVFQNSTGSSALAVFGPQFFSLLVGTNEKTDLLLVGLFGAVKVIACTFFIFLLAERFGRRSLLTFGSVAMATCMLITALVVKFKPPPATGVVTAAGKATVAMIYLDIMIYNCSWGPLPWAYVPEIFPTRTRALGLGISMLAHWLSSFVFSFASPYMITNIGWGSFLLFSMLDICAAFFCWVFVSETRGKNLEDASGVEWATVERAAVEVSSDSEKGGEEGGPNGEGDVERVDKVPGAEVQVVGAKVGSMRIPGLKHRI